MFVKKIFSYFILFVLIATSVFIWRSVDLPCEKPLAYSIGSFDSRFGISQEEFLKRAAVGEKLWEDVVGKQLFSYSPDAPFKINLIFDERQLQTLDAQELNKALDETQNTEASLTAKQNEILAAYKKTLKEYESLAVSLRKQLSSYNAEVEKWNKRGGAPADEYEKLQEEAKSLEKKQKNLEDLRQKVNSLADEVNKFSQQKVSIVNEYNEKLENYVSQYGEPKAFDQGDYVGTEINIYQFDDRPHLEAVLTHEFGHAMGLVHAGGPLSIMYPLMDKQKLDPIMLSSEDKAMISSQCSQTIWDIVFRRIDQVRNGI